jgi:hypothetical protein
MDCGLSIVATIISISVYKFSHDENRLKEARVSLK